MAVLVLDMCFKKNSIYKNEFVKPIIDILQKNNINFKIKHFLNVKKQDINNADKLILCGVALKDYFAWRKTSKIKFLLNFSKPILGICIGAQVIGKLFGAKLIKDLQIGVFRAKNIKEEKLSNLIKDKGVYILHNYNINKTKNFLVLAKVNSSSLLFKHKQKPIYLAMFHPEVLNKDFVLEFAQS